MIPEDGKTCSKGSAGRRLSVRLLFAGCAEPGPHDYDALVRTVEPAFIGRSAASAARRYGALLYADQLHVARDRLQIRHRLGASTLYKAPEVKFDPRVHDRAGVLHVEGRHRPDVHHLPQGAETRRIPACSMPTAVSDQHHPDSPRRSLHRAGRVYCEANLRGGSVRRGGRR